MMVTGSTLSAIDYPCMHLQVASEEVPMRLAGMFLLLAGWGIVVSAVVLFPRPVPRVLFVLAGLGLQALGLSLAFRSRARLPEDVR
jgi:hypothetical protein